MIMIERKLEEVNPELVQAVERLINQVSSKTQPNVNLRITELEKEKSKLTSKALKQFPQSPAQMKTRARIDEINAELKTLKAEPEGYELLYARQSITTSNLSSMYGRCIALLEYAAVALEGKAYCDKKIIAQRIKIAVEELEVGWNTRYEKKD